MNKKNVKSLVLTVAVAIVLVFFIRQNVFASVVVKSNTNVNNKFKIGDRAFINLMNKTPKVNNYIIFK